MSNIYAIKLHDSKKFTNFLKTLDAVPDFRNKESIDYHLTDILIMMIVATLGGSNNPAEIETFCKLHIAWISDILCLQCVKIPSHDTFIRVLGYLNPTEFEFWLNLWRDNFTNILTGRHIAFDGKCDKANQKQLLRAYDCSSNAVIAHLKIPKNNNEITLAPSLLNLIDLKDRIITGDAMHAQKKNVNTIIQNGGDYLFTIKRNQHQFYEDVALYLNDLFDNRPLDAQYSIHESSEKSRGRSEHRICLSTSNIGWLWQRKYWKKLRSISIVQTTRVIKDKTTVERRCFISSLEADSINIMKLVRNHWGIENLCHRHLDVDFASDWSTLRDDNASLNLNIIKDFALSLLKNNDQKGSIRSKRFECAFRFESLMGNLIN